MAPYPIPSATIRIEHRVSNSRFYGTVGRASTVEDAKTFIQSVRDEMPDASHHVYAYVIGFGASVTEGMSDDGEPSGTSGPPSLAVIRGSGIGDIVLVTTRYFGGTKLGTGGLVHAYGQTAREAVKALPTELKITRIMLGLDTPYHLYERVKLLLADVEADIDDEQFAADVAITFRIPEENATSLQKQLQDLSSGQIEAIRLDT